MNPYEAPVPVDLPPVRRSPVLGALGWQALGFFLAMMVAIVSCGVCAPVAWVAPGFGALVWGLRAGRRDGSLPLSAAVWPGVVAAACLSLLWSLTLGALLIAAPETAPTTELPADVPVAVVVVGATAMLLVWNAALSVLGGVAGIAIGGRFAAAPPGPSPTSPLTPPR